MNHRRPLKVLVCSDGSERGAGVVRTAALITVPGAADTTLLGIREGRGEPDTIMDALQEQRRLLEREDAPVELIVAAGEPVAEIVRRTEETDYDLVVIGAFRRGRRVTDPLTARTYRIAKAIRPPVLVAIGERGRLAEILLSIGIGGAFTSKGGSALEITGRVARAAGARVTIFHVVAEPPAMHAGLRRRQSNTETILRSDPTLARGLEERQAQLRELGVRSRIRVRHGFVADEILAERQREDYDLVIVGSPPAAGSIRSFLLGGVTREVLDLADCPIMVVRTGLQKDRSGGLARRLGELLASAMGRRHPPPDEG
ncbi:MAG TPA: universal stress protein [Gemmatimonadota bacterium]|nr:universal stress protein [Gemmatimonadota bacterium]